MLVNVLVIAGPLPAGVVHLERPHDLPGDPPGARRRAPARQHLLLHRWPAGSRRRRGRDDVTAMPYGPSVPHMFIVSLVIMLPIYLKTHDPIKAWEGGIAWAFIIGVIILIGAFVGPTIRRFTPRAALLGTLAGISLTFISMRPAAQMWGALWIALPTFIIIVIGFVVGRAPAAELPGRAGRAAARLGDRLDRRLHEHGRRQHVGPPDRDRPAVAEHRSPGQRAEGDLAAAGDGDPARHLQLHRGDEQRRERGGGRRQLQPPPRAAGRRHRCRRSARRWAARSRRPSTSVTRAGRRPADGSRYSLATGVGIFLFCAIGLFPLLAALLPIPAIVPILLYIGLVIGAQAFASVPRAHYPAIVLATIPNIAQWASGPGRRHALRGGHDGGQGRDRQPRERRGDLPGPRVARPGRRARRHGARGDRRADHRPALRDGRRATLLRGDPGVLRPDPRAEGRAGTDVAEDRARLRDRPASSAWRSRG